MKRIFIGLTALVMCVALAGCGENNAEMTLNNLGSQLDETSNIISSVKTINPADITLSKDALETIATSENSSAIYDNVIGTQQTLLNEEYYKTDILSRTAKLKNSLAKGLKLSKAQTTAIKELTNNLEKYSNSVACTRNDMTYTLRQISSLKKNAEKNSDKINAKLNRLACNSNARSSYYENIIFTLSQIEAYLNAPQESQENILQENSQNVQSDQQNATAQDATPMQTNKICPNCYVLTQSDKCENCGYEFCQNCENDDCEPANESSNESQETEETKKNKEKFANSPYAKFNSNNINRANLYPYNMYGMPYNGMNGGFGGTPYGFYGANGFGGYGNGAYGRYGAYPQPYGYGNFGGAYGTFGMNGFGNGFSTPYANGGLNGNNINFGRFNPNRNTDTYAPLVRNIDTYRAGTNVNILPASQKEIGNSTAQKVESVTDLPAKEEDTEETNAKETDETIMEETKEKLQANFENFPDKEVSSQPQQRLENFEEVVENNFVEKKESTSPETKQSLLQKSGTQSSLSVSAPAQKHKTPNPHKDLGPPVVAY